MRRIVALGALAMVAACGQRTPLEPPPGAAPPPVPVGAQRPLTSEQLLAPPTTARPARVDELLRRSEERQPDRFDLPPSDVGTFETESGRDPGDVSTGDVDRPQPDEDDPG